MGRYKLHIIVALGSLGAFALGCGDDGGGGGGGDTDAGTDAAPVCEPGGSLGIDPSGLPACPETLCTSGGHCVPNNILGGMDSVGFLGACSDTATCVPDVFIMAGGETVPPSCTSVAGAEGRCISTCVPQVSEQADLLPQDDCAEGELCAPCFDPRTGDPTGACTLSCDMPEDPPLEFDPCCEGSGSCVPSDLVPAEFADMIPEDTCTDEGTLCAPNPFVQDINYEPPSCTAQLMGGSSPLGPGACLAKCVVVHNAPEGLEGTIDLLEQTDTCADGEVCAPCEFGGESTGACDIGGGTP